MRALTFSASIGRLHQSSQGNPMSRRTNRTAFIALSLCCLAVGVHAADRSRVVNEGGIRDEWTFADGVKPVAPALTQAMKDSTATVARTGRESGRMTRQNVCSRVAPSVNAASSTSLEISASTGSTVRTTKGRPMKVRATTTPAGL